MKEHIRYNTFETNSSSVHAIVVLPAKVMDEWKNSPKMFLFIKPEIFPEDKRPEKYKFYDLNEALAVIRQVREVHSLEYFQYDMEEYESYLSELLDNYRCYTFRSWNPPDDFFYGGEDMDYYETDGGELLAIRTLSGYSG